MSEGAITLTRTAERVTVHIPMTLRRSSGHRRIIAPEIIEPLEETASNKPPTKLAIAVAKAHQGNAGWMKDATGMSMIWRAR